MARRTDDDDSNFERIRRLPPSHCDRRSVTELAVSQSEAARFEAIRHELAPAFKDAGLQELYERGLITRLVTELKSGKEATLYLGYSESGPVAVKLYKDLHVRSFRNDEAYRQGRSIGDARLQKAMEQRTRRGMAAREGMWVAEEFRQLAALHAFGVRVPRPLGQAGRAIIMEFIGDNDQPAPRLSDIRLDPPDAHEAFRQSVENLRLIVQSGRVHGDFSTYNLLWHHGTVIVIDLPQVALLDANSNAQALLQRDIQSLCGSFKRHGVYADPHAVWNRLL